AETHLARGAHLSQAFRDYKGALSELEAARAGLANDPRILQFTGSILLHQGRPEEGLRALEQAVALDPRNPYMLSRLAISCEGLLAHAMHDEGRAQKAFAAARLEQEQIVQQQKDYGPPVCVLGLIDAALGNKEAALQEGRRAMELLPVEKDSIDGQSVRAYFA